MRNAMLLLTLALGLGALTAQMSPLHLVGEGHFAGKAAVHSEPGLALGTINDSTGERYFLKPQLKRTTAKLSPALITVPFTA